MTDEQKQAVERVDAFLLLASADMVKSIREEALKALGNDLSTLLKAVREMGEDTKRLDWLEKAYLLNLYDPSGNRFFSWVKGKPIRQAIDAESGKEGVRRIYE